MDRRVSIFAVGVALVTALSAPAVAASHGTASTRLPRGHTYGEARTEPGRGLDPTNPAGCDPSTANALSVLTAPATCLLPWPSDWQTRADPSAVTGRRLNISGLATPRDVAGKPVDVTDIDRSDGFSPGQSLIVRVPGLDDAAALAANHLPTLADMSGYLAPDQRVVVLNAATGQRQMIWAEIDPNGHNLVIHPGVNFEERTRYVVALRDLVTAAGARIPAPAGFATYRDNPSPSTGPRAAHMAELFGFLAQVGVHRANLHLAWDFTVASTESTTRRLLAMRDRAFAGLGDANLADGIVNGSPPAYTVLSREDRTPAQDPEIARRVTLQVDVPCFIFPTCSVIPPALADHPFLNQVPLPVSSPLPLDTVPTGGPGAFLLEDPTNPDSVPRRNPVDFQARVICDIPRRAIDGPSPVRVRPSLYGHGLFGSGDEVGAGNVRDQAAHAGFMFCAPDWYGMAWYDVPNAAVALADLSNFPVIADRMQQGILDFLFVARLMIHPKGLAIDPAFQVGGKGGGKGGGKSVIDPAAVYYDGNSQGGIYGGTVLAVSPDVRHAVNGVTGMNYSVLLFRSSDFVGSSPTAYASILETFYRDPAVYSLVLGLIQLEWDRSDANGYAAHMTDRPLPNTPSHTALLQIGWGDHQVSNWQAIVEARTIGAGVAWPALVPARSVGRDPFYGLARVPAARFPYAGSLLQVLDSGPVRTAAGQTVGTSTPPIEDQPSGSGDDPHEQPRRTACAMEQKADFLRPGGLIQMTCPLPAFSQGWDGRAGLAH